MPREQQSTRAFDIDRLAALCFDRPPEDVWNHLTREPARDLLFELELASVRAAQAPPPDDDDLWLAVYYRGPAVLAEHPRLLSKLQEIWEQARGGLPLTARFEARQRYARIWSFPREDIDDGRKRRDHRDPKAIAESYGRAVHQVRPLRRIRNRATVARRLTEIFPKATPRTLSSLMTWCDRQPGADLRDAICAALGNDLGLERTSIRDLVAKGRRLLNEEKRRADERLDWRRRAWAGYRRFLAWCEKQGRTPPCGPPEFPEPV